jgi:hypothetical protein
MSTVHHSDLSNKNFTFSYIQSKVLVMETVFKAETLSFLILLLFVLISTANGQLNTSVIAFGANDVKKEILTFS